MNRAGKLRVTSGIRVISVLLIVGGIVGIVVVLVMDTRLLTSGRLLSPGVVIDGIFNLAVGGAFIVLLGWAIWTGIELWRGRRRALTWAIILFAMQVPSLTIPRFSYEFYTGIVMQVLVGSSGANFAFNFGSSFDFHILGSFTGFVFGLNLAAIAILIYLVRARKNTVVAATLAASQAPI